MGEWRKTGCAMCAQNCGLEALVEDNSILKTRPDKDNPRSSGYACRKGLNVAYHQNQAERLTDPLKRAPAGFEKISWDQAIDEIAGKLREILDRYGPRSLAYMGGGGQACHFEAAFGVRLLRALGSRYHYSALAQELTGFFWVQGRANGRQYLAPIPDEERTDMLVAWGWNGWMSHQMPQARRVLDRISKDPHKLLVAVDPRKSETARRADIHLAVRPGADALLAKAMIAITLEEGWADKSYIDERVSGFEHIAGWFANFDVRSALDVCELEYEQVREVCRLMGERTWAVHTDLGVYMNRHSTATSYLVHILMALSGVIGVRGGNVFPGAIMPLGSHSDERDPRSWRTMTTDFPEIMGTFPPNVLPEEILSDHPERIRAVLVSGANPLRSYADTNAYEKAFQRLDLLVTTELAMTETAALSHYVLPARSAYESWDGSFFAWTWPEIYFQMRRPIVEAKGQPLEVSQIYTRLADRLGLIPEIPDTLKQAAKGNRLQFGMALMSYTLARPEARKMAPFIMAQTLGETLGSANLAALWGLLMTAPQSFREHAARAGFTPGPTMGEDIFRAIVDHPEGLWVGKLDPDKNFEELQTGDKRINVYIPELEDWVKGIDSRSESAALARDTEYPYVLNAGRHMDMNANTLMRDPAWNKGRRACAAAINPLDAGKLEIRDGELIRVTTEADSVEVEAEVTEETRPGMVLIPHGFGLNYLGNEYGVNVNRLTKNTNRDPLAGTPLHRHTLCKLEKSPV